MPEPQTNMLKMRAGTTIKDINFALFMDNVLNSNPVLGPEPPGRRDAALRSEHAPAENVRADRDV